MEITYVRHLDLVALLEVLRERVDEFFGRNVLNSHSTAGVDESLLHLPQILDKTLFNLTSIVASYLLMLILNNKCFTSRCQIYIFDYL